MMVKTFITPNFIIGKMIKNVRNQLDLTQKEFKGLINTSVSTIERWETSEKEITGPIALLILLLAENVGLAEELIIPKKKYPMRLWYMHEERVCTLIDVDENNRQISIKNYTNKVMFRAFGKIEKPTFGQYEDWLESRCFPKERDKIEDRFWIKIER